MELISMQRKFVSPLLRYTFLSLIAVSVIYPLLWVFLGSIKSQEELIFNPWGFPSTFQLDPYASILWEYRLHVNIANSIWIVGVSTIAVVLLSAMTAYGVVRMRWRGSKAVLAFILLGIMVPGHATLIPVYLNLQMFRDVLDDRIVLLIPYIAGGIAQSVLILSGYFYTMSREIEEAAIMDGSSLLGMFFKIILPIASPAIATVSIFSFIFTWNELLYALVFLERTEHHTISVAILKFVGFYSTDWSKVLASISLTMLPSIAVYMFFQNKIVQGIADGAVKS